MSTDMILVNSAELTLSDFVEDGQLKRGLFYRGMRVTTAGCPRVSSQYSLSKRGKEWVRPLEQASEWDEKFPE